MRNAQCGNPVYISLTSLQPRRYNDKSILLYLCIVYMYCDANLPANFLAVHSALRPSALEKTYKLCNTHSEISSRDNRQGVYLRTIFVHNSPHDFRDPSKMLEMSRRASS